MIDELTEAESRMLELLRSQHEFPGPYTIKVIYRSDLALASNILERLQDEAGVSPPRLEPSLRSSSGGKFLSMSATFELQRAEEVVSIYRVLGNLENVVSFF